MKMKNKKVRDISYDPISREHQLENENCMKEK
jgi:hypothetical protein